MAGNFSAMIVTVSLSSVIASNGNPNIQNET
jgi:hypothetical protein